MSVHYPLKGKCSYSVLIESLSFISIPLIVNNNLKLLN